MQHILQEDRKAARTGVFVTLAPCNVLYRQLSSKEPPTVRHRHLPPDKTLLLAAMTLAARARRAWIWKMTTAATECGSTSSNPTALMFTATYTAYLCSRQFMPNSSQCYNCDHLFAPFTQDGLKPDSGDPNLTFMKTDDRSSALPFCPCPVAQDTGKLLFRAFRVASTPTAVCARTGSGRWPQRYLSRFSSRRAHCAAQNGVKVL